MFNDFIGYKDGSILFNLCYSEENDVPHFTLFSIMLNASSENLESIVI